MINLAAIKPTTLKQQLSLSALSVVVREFADRQGNKPTFASLLTEFFVIVVKQGDQWEQIKITNLTQNSDGSATLTIPTGGRNLLPVPPYTGGDTGLTFGSATADVIVTNDMATMNEYPRLKNDNVFTGYNKVPDPLALTDIANKQWVMGIVNGGAVSVDRIVIAGTAGETFSAGQLVYLKASDSRWYKALANDTIFNSAQNIQLGIALSAGSSGVAIASGVGLFGNISGLSGLTANSLYYLSDTGAFSLTPGTYAIPVGWATSTTNLVFSPKDYNNPTPDEKSALGGSQGVPKSTNKYITQDNVYTSDTDQTQTTQNGTVSTGEANTTGSKNLLAQSFTAGKTKIRGVVLYKSTNTGTFTGTVTVSLQADTAGSPSGSDLASVTISNATYLSLSNGEFNAIFSTEYASQVAGSLYWIVVTTSTSDTSNHPNLGTNTAGGYANGSVKYKNTTDGWVAISTIDLYFKTLQGINSQIGLVPVTETFLTSGTWVKPSTTNNYRVFVQVWGGGGSGGYGSGNGGGGGAYNEAWIDPSVLSSTETVTIGAGGAARTSSNHGLAGGTSSFGSKVIAYGGGGGAGAGTVASFCSGGGGGGVLGVGVSSSSGVFGFGGSPSGSITGTMGASVSNTAGRDNSYGGGGGGSGSTAGGSSIFGGGGGAGGSGTGAGGNSIFGGAGGGAYNGVGGTSIYGGAGGNGVISGTAGNGSVPGGGGGSADSGASSGAGGAGKIVVTIFY